MKLARSILLSPLLICTASSELTRGLKADKKLMGGSKSSKPYSSKSSKSNGPVRYMADLAHYGTFKMDVYPNGTTVYDVSLQKLTFATVNELTWHLHSGKIGSGPSNASNGSATATACGPTYTAGHYDPWLKCGAASTGPLCTNSTSEPPCCLVKPATGYCAVSNIGSCEVGDLSGLHGKINITDKSGKLHAKGLCPGCVKDYHPKASATDGTAVYNTWASVVFHGSNVSAGERILCADVKMV